MAPLAPPGYAYERYSSALHFEVLTFRLFVASLAILCHRSTFVRKSSMISSFCATVPSWLTKAVGGFVDL